MNIPSFRIILLTARNKLACIWRYSARLSRILGRSPWAHFQIRQTTYIAGYLPFADGKIAVDMPFTPSLVAFTSAYYCKCRQFFSPFLVSNGQRVSQRPQSCALMAFHPLYAQQIPGAGCPGNKNGMISPSNYAAGACITEMYNLDVYNSCICLIKSLCFTATLF